MKKLLFLLTAFWGFTLACGGTIDPDEVSKKITAGSSAEDDAKVYCKCMKGALKADSLGKTEEIAEACESNIMQAMEKKLNKVDESKVAAFGKEFHTQKKACMEKLRKKYSKKIGDIKKDVHRQNVLIDIDSIKTAQIAYEAQGGAYTECQPYPPKPSGRSPQPWVSAESGGFATINYKADVDVFGSYSVTVAADGMDFTVTGVSDIDGDGVYATYTATSRSKAQLITGKDIY